MSDVPRYYVLVRADLNATQQMVSVCHACRIAGSLYKRPDYAHLVLLAVKDDAELGAASIKITNAGIGCYLFIEPDGDVGAAAICTEPVDMVNRRVFKGYPLWKPQLAYVEPPITLVRAMLTNTLKNLGWTAEQVVAFLESPEGVQTLAAYDVYGTAIPFVNEAQRQIAIYEAALAGRVITTDRTNDRVG